MDKLRLLLLELHQTARPSPELSLHYLLNTLYQTSLFQHLHHIPLLTERLFLTHTFQLNQEDLLLTPMLFHQLHQDTSPMLLKALPTVEQLHTQNHQKLLEHQSLYPMDKLLQSQLYTPMRLFLMEKLKLH
jgi:hypothetical protein